MNTPIEKIASIGAPTPILTAEELAAAECRRLNLVRSIHEANGYLGRHYPDAEPIVVTEGEYYTGVTVNSLGVTRLVPKYVAPEKLLEQ